MTTRTKWILAALAAAAVGFWLWRRNKSADATAPSAGEQLAQAPGSGTAYYPASGTTPTSTSNPSTAQTTPAAAAAAAAPKTYGGVLASVLDAFRAGAYSEWQARLAIQGKKETPARLEKFRRQQLKAYVAYQNSPEQVQARLDAPSGGGVGTPTATPATATTLAR